jgi:RNA polymerase sigma factor (sigma-70 family)
VIGKVVYKEKFVKFHEEQLNILKDLFVEQQKNPSEKTFNKILQRVDQMLEEIIRKFSRIYFYRESIPQLLQDMYQTGIVGLATAIQKFDASKKASSIPIWILICVRHELFQTYGVERMDVAQYAYEHPDCIERSNVDSRLVQEDIREILTDMKQTSKITEDEIELVKCRYIECMKFKEIEKRFKGRLSGYLIRKKLDKAMRILRKEFEEKGMGD